MDSREKLLRQLTKDPYGNEKILSWIAFVSWIVLNTGILLIPIHLGYRLIILGVVNIIFTSMVER